MKLNMKALFGIWFWIWVVSTIILGIGAACAPTLRKVLCATILATFALLPMHDWIYQLTIWVLRRMSTISTKIRNKIIPYTTLSNLLKPENKEDNKVFYFTIRFTVFDCMLILALIFMTFQRLPMNIIYIILHTVEFIVTGKIGWFRLLIYVVLLNIFFFVMKWAFRLFAREEILDDDGKFIKEDWWKIAIIIATILVKIIFTTILLKFTFYMSMYYLFIILLTVACLVVLTLLIKRKIEKWLA